jgi:hypothetical protein
MAKSDIELTESTWILSPETVSKTSIALHLNSTTANWRPFP